jgi:hypothetical protein
MYYNYTIICIYAGKLKLNIRRKRGPPSGFHDLRIKDINHISQNQIPLQNVSHTSKLNCNKID